MLTRSQFADLAAYARARGIAALTVEAADWSLTLEFQPGAAPEAGAAPPQPEAETVPVRTAGFGTLLAAHPLASSPFAMPGDVMRRGDILALLRTGSIYRPVRAPADGTFDGLLSEPGALAGYGQTVTGLRTREDADG